jgi:hypothetical protein
MALKVPAFSGMTPLVAPHLLDPTKAQQATNTKLNRGDLRAFKDTLAVLTLAAGPAPTTIYRYPESGSLDTQYWFQWTDDVDVVRSPIADDDWERVYWSGETTGGADYARYTKNDIATTGAPYPSTRRRLGVPAPDTAPAHSVSGSPTDPDSLNLTVVYAVTFVTDVGEEGPISRALDGSQRTSLGQSVDLSSIPVAPPVAWTGLLNITSKRHLPLGDRDRMPPISSSWRSFRLRHRRTPIRRNQDELGEVCPSKLLGAAGHWPAWPHDGRQRCGAGFVQGDRRRTSRRRSCLTHGTRELRGSRLEYPIIAVGAIAAGIRASPPRDSPTFSKARIASSMTVTKLPNKQACVAKRSLVEMEGSVVYASPDGLVMIDGRWS